MVQPTFLHLLRRTLRLWILLPGVLFILTLGALQANNAYKEIQKRNRVVSGAISYYVSSYIDDALHALQRFAKRTGADAESIKRNLETFYGAFPHFERLLWISKNRDILAAAPPGVEGLIFPIVMNIHHEGGILSRPIISPGSGQPVIYMGMKRPTGNMLVGEMDTLTLSQHLGGLLPPGNTIILTDAYGNIVSHPDRARVLRQENIGGMSLMLPPLGEEKVRTRLFLHEGTFYIGSLAAIPGENWKIVIISEAASLFVPVLQTVCILLALVSILFLITNALMDNALKAGLVLPLEDFIHDIKRLGQGDDITNAPIRSTYRELKIVEEEFRKMSREVRGREDELSENAERHRALFHDNQLVLLLVDPATGAILDANKRAAEYYGYPVNTLKALTIFNINAQEEGYVRGIVTDIARQGKAASVRTKHRLSSDEVRDVELHVSPMTIHGHSRHFITVIDVSDPSCP